MHHLALGLDQVPGGEVEADDDFGAGVEGLAGVNQQSALTDVFGAADAGRPRTLVRSYWPTCAPPRASRTSSAARLRTGRPELPGVGCSSIT